MLPIRQTASYIGLVLMVTRTLPVLLPVSSPKQKDLKEPFTRGYHALLQDVIIMGLSDSKTTKDGV